MAGTRVNNGNALEGLLNVDNFYYQGWPFGNATVGKSCRGADSELVIGDVVNRQACPYRSRVQPSSGIRSTIGLFSPSAFAF